MEEERTDVLPESSSGSESADQQSSDSSTVNRDVAGADQDRPFGNLRAEFNRKLERVEGKLAEIASYLGAVTAVTPKLNQRTDSGERREYTDADLLAMARAGSDEAMEQYVQRKVTAAHSDQQNVERADLFIKTQLAQLYRMYPVLAQDPNHPLTQAALQAKRLLLANGYADGYAVDLEAAKLAIADAPGVAAQALVGSGRVAENVRRSTTSAQQDVEGRTPRRESRELLTERVSDRSVEIASRFGVKDPKKAREKFWKNQSGGRSSVSPTLSILLKEE